MKKITFLLFALIVGTTFAQSASDNAQVLAEIVTPLQITKGLDLRFGTLAPHAEEARTVTVNPVEGAVRNSTTPNILINGGGEGGPASFSITGSTNEAYTYDITLASENESKLKSPDGKSMEITYDLGGKDDESQSGNQTLYVGGTLTLAGAQPEGAYSDQITVTISYN